MQGRKIRLLAGGLLMVAAAGHVRADALLPDPAWQQGTLANGMKWQVLATPQRPSDRIEIRLLINTGSLTESTQQSGYSYFIPRLALTQSGSLPPEQARAIWQQGAAAEHPLPPVTVSWDSTLFTLSLPNSRSDLLKETIAYLSDISGNLAISPEAIDHALRSESGVATWPEDPGEGWWRYRLKGSALLGHDPAGALKQPVDAGQLKSYYQKWYTPDAMTLIVVGNVDARAVTEQINKTFGELQGKRDAPAPVPTLSPLDTTPVSIMTDSVQQDRLAIMWDNPWQPIRESGALLRYWRADLAREALFWHVQQSLSQNKVKDMALSFECHVLFLRAQCAINIDTPNNQLSGNFALVARELAKVRDNGLPEEAFKALVAQKQRELQRLFATYARTDTGLLINQRMRSLQNQVVDIAPEQYQHLRQNFLNTLTVEMLNQDLRQQLSQDMALILLQPKGEAEFNMKALQAAWRGTMMPAPPPARPAVGDNENPQQVKDIPSAHQVFSLYPPPLVGLLAGSEKGGV